VNWNSIVAVLQERAAWSSRFLATSEQTTSFAVLITACALAIGTAWAGLLANFAAEAFLLVLRPFKVGDFITAGGVTGTVHEVGLFVTNSIPRTMCGPTLGKIAKRSRQTRARRHDREFHAFQPGPGGPALLPQ
jgi:hypothetical protein